MATSGLVVIDPEQRKQRDRLTQIQISLVLKLGHNFRSPVLFLDQDIYLPIMYAYHIMYIYTLEYLESI